MEREQFTFYASFAKAIQRIRKAADRAAAYDAIVNYALYEQQPDLDKLPDSVCIVFDLIRPNLDTSRRKAQGGKATRQTEDAAKMRERQTGDTGNKYKKEKEGEKEKEIENECYTTPTPPLGEVMDFFMNNINAMPSPDVCDQLRQYTETLSAPVVIHAMQITQNERKGWSYLKAILGRYEREGLTSEEAVKASEQAREQAKGQKPGGRQMMTAEAYAARDIQPIDMDKLRTVIDRI